MENNPSQYGTDMLILCQMASAVRDIVFAAEGRLGQERRDFEAARTLVAELNRAQEKEITSLDVGGLRFHTAKDNLSREECMLQTLVSGIFCQDLQDDGSMFLDRDPSHFYAVLAYLRDPETLMIPERRAERRALFREAHFYALEGLGARIRSFTPALVPGDLTFSAFDATRYLTAGEDRRRLIKTSHVGAKMAVCGLPMTKGRHHWTLRTTTPLLGVGIVQTPRHEDIRPGSDETSFLFYGKPNEVWHAGRTRPYGQPLMPNDTVRVELDLGNGDGHGTLAFVINDTPYGEAFTIDRPGPFYPAVYIYSKVGHFCTILNSFHEPED